MEDEVDVMVGMRILNCSDVFMVRSLVVGGQFLLIRGYDWQIDGRQDFVVNYGIGWNVDCCYNDCSCDQC